MLARNETIFKWALYAGATAVFFLLQGAVLQRITLWGVIPFVFPILVAVLGMYEGPLPASVYALTVGVLKDGPACHLGTESCFNETVYQSEENHGFSIDGLMELLEGRKADKPEGSYTTYLFEKGLDKILKKVGEESTEVIIAAKAEDKKETIYEIADLAYHVLVLMVEAGISLEDVRKELASRHIIDHKVKQEKMTK